MTGQELLKLQESNAFRPAVMDTIINEFVPPADAFTLTNAFMPFKLVDQIVLLDLINNGAFGRTYPANYDAEPKSIGIPGHSYRQHTEGLWRERVVYGEAVLKKAVNPAQPTERWGDGLVASALNFLDMRLNTLIEYVTAKILINGKHSEARYGVNYTYDPKIPAKYQKDVTSTPGWTTGGTWATASAATPITDIMEAANLLRRYGIVPDKVYMSSKTSMDFWRATDTQNRIKSSYLMIGRNADVEALFDPLTGLKLVRDIRLYAEEAQLTADSAATDTTLNVEDASEFAAGDVVTLRNALGDEEEKTISSISANVITLTAGVTNVYKIGDRVTAYKQFLPDNYFILAGKTEDRIAPNNWISTPSIVKGQSFSNPMPGRYTWRDFDSRKPPYRVEVGAGIEGGPKVSRCTWMRVKTTA